MLVYALAAAAAVGIVVIAALLFRRLGRDNDDRDPAGATAAHAGAMLSALFLLVFAIAIVVPWTAADAARQNTYTESQAIVDAYWAAAELPAPVARDVRAELEGYVEFVITREWPQMARGRLDTDGWKRLDRLRARVTGIEAAGDERRDARTAVLEQVKSISSARRQRAADAGGELPSGVIVMTLLSGAAVALFPFLAGARPRGMTVVPLLVMSAMLGVGIYLVLDITRVFTGALAVAPDAFTAVRAELARVAGAG
jgi:hypothetical protein